MKFLFEAITVENSAICYYRIYNIGPDKYYAQGMNGEEDFVFKRENDDWIPDEPGTSKQAEQIGEEVIRKQGSTNSTW